MKTLYKLAVILLLASLLPGCVLLQPRGGYGYGGYGNQGYGYGNYSPEPPARRAWTQIGPYSGNGGWERRHACTQYGVGCIR